MWSQLRQIHFKWNIATQNHHACIALNTLTMFNEARFEFRCLSLSSSNNSVNITILINQFRCGLLAHSWDSCQVVTWITAQSCIIGVLRRGYASALKNSCFVVQRVITNASLVIQNSNVRVAHQLITITIACNDNEVIAGTFSMFSNCCYEIVALETGLFPPDNTEHIKKFPNHSQLLKQNIWRFFTLRFVLGHSFVSKRRLRPVKNHYNAVWFMVAHQCQQHCGEAVHGICHLTTCIGHIFRQCIEGAIRQRVAIKRHDQHGEDPITILDAVRLRSPCQRLPSWWHDDS